MKFFLISTALVISFSTSAVEVCKLSNESDVPYKRRIAADCTDKSDSLVFTDYIENMEAKEALLIKRLVEKGYSLKTETLLIKE